MQSRLQNASPTTSLPSFTHPGYNRVSDAQHRPTSGWGVRPSSASTSMAPSFSINSTSFTSIPPSNAPTTFNSLPKPSIQTTQPPSTVQKQAPSPPKVNPTTTAYSIGVSKDKGNPTSHLTGSSSSSLAKVNLADFDIIPYEDMIWIPTQPAIPLPLPLPPSSTTLPKTTVPTMPASHLSSSASSHSVSSFSSSSSSSSSVSFSNLSTSSSSSSSSSFPYKSPATTSPPSASKLTVPTTRKVSPVHSPSRSLNQEMMIKEGETAILRTRLQASAKEIDTLRTQLSSEKEEHEREMQRLRDQLSFKEKELRELHTTQQGKAPPSANQPAVAMSQMVSLYLPSDSESEGEKEVNEEKNSRNKTRADARRAQKTLTFALPPDHVTQVDSKKRVRHHHNAELEVEMTKSKSVAEPGRESDVTYAELTSCREKLAMIRQILCAPQSPTKNVGSKVINPAVHTEACVCEEYKRKNLELESRCAMLEALLKEREQENANLRILAQEKTNENQAAITGQKDVPLPGLESSLAESDIQDALTLNPSLLFHVIGKETAAVWAERCSPPSAMLGVGKGEAAERGGEGEGVEEGVGSVEGVDRKRKSAELQMEGEEKPSSQQQREREAEGALSTQERAQKKRREERLGGSLINEKNNDVAVN